MDAHSEWQGKILKEYPYIVVTEHSSEVTLRGSYKECKRCTTIFNEKNKYAHVDIYKIVGAHSKGILKEPPCIIVEGLNEVIMRGSYESCKKWAAIFNNKNQYVHMNIYQKVEE
jgi:hypothetical protein